MIKASSKSYRLGRIFFIHKARSDRIDKIAETESVIARLSNQLRSRKQDKSQQFKTLLQLVNKKIFFDYDIEASVAVYTSRSIIKKDTQISLLNVMRQNVVLDRFRAKPLQNIEANLLQSKRHIPKDMILTIRDVESLDVVKKDSIINVSLFKDGMGITFSAKALQDAKVDDIIKVQNNNGKILKARVTGSNAAELE